MHAPKLLMFLLSGPSGLLSERPQSIPTGDVDQSYFQYQALRLKIAQQPYINNMGPETLEQESFEP